MALRFRASTHSVRLGVLLVAAILGSGLTCPVEAQESQPDTVWKCWYSQDWRIQCVLGSARADSPADPRYANNPRLPQTVRQLWVEAASMADYRVFIPLYTEPEDWDRVRLLAESVMCGANRRCVVDFNRSFAEAALLDPSIEP